MLLGFFVHEVIDSLQIATAEARVENGGLADKTDLFQLTKTPFNVG